MTEADWLASEDPVAMLRHLTHYQHPDFGEACPRERPLTSARKLRLFAYACWVLAGRYSLPDGRSQYETIGEDGQADDAGDPDGLWIANAWVKPEGTAKKIPQATKAHLLRDVAGNPFRDIYADVEIPRGGYGTSKEGERIGWAADPLVLSLAQAAYDERRPDGTLDNDRLAVLADALEEAGCPMEVEVVCRVCKGAGVREDEIGVDHACYGCSPGGNWAGTGKQTVPHPLLGHLRSGGVHVRGMWSLDLVLGKE